MRPLLHRRCKDSRRIQSYSKGSKRDAVAAGPPSRRRRLSVSGDRRDRPFDTFGSGCCSSRRCRGCRPNPRPRHKVVQRCAGAGRHHRRSRYAISRTTFTCRSPRSAAPDCPRCRQQHVPAASSATSSTALMRVEAARLRKGKTSRSRNSSDDAVLRPRLEVMRGREPGYIWRELGIELSSPEYPSRQPEFAAGKYEISLFSHLLRRRRRLFQKRFSGKLRRLQAGEGETARRRFCVFRHRSPHDRAASGGQRQSSPCRSSRRKRTAETVLCAPTPDAGPVSSTFTSTESPFRSARISTLLRSHRLQCIADKIRNTVRCAFARAAVRSRIDIGFNLHTRCSAGAACVSEAAQSPH